jgi:dTDP-4-amino-4,6-dideoxygalactose transaminase
MIKEYPVGSTFDAKEINALSELLLSGRSLTCGEEIELFEKDFARYVGAKHAVAVSSCGAALTIANQLLGLKKGDEVIVQDNAFWVTIVNLLGRGVDIKCADIDADSLNIDVDKIEQLISDNTKAIYVMHHGGNPADLDNIKKLADEYGIVVVEDAAHAVGSIYRGRKIGCDSDVACFSFSTLKNMTTLGEGGMLVTNSGYLADMARGLRTNYPFGSRIITNRLRLGKFLKPHSVSFMRMGDTWDYTWRAVSEFGSSYRMSVPQAVVGRIQLKKLDRHNLMREKIAKRYNEAIDGFDDFRTVKILPGCRHSWHLYSFFVNLNSNISRDRFVDVLKKHFGVEVILRFYPIHLGGIMRLRGHVPGECPIYEHVWFREQLSLPISPQMRSSEVNEVISAIKKTVKLVE